MTFRQPPRDRWYKSGKNGDELAGPVTVQQLRSLATRGLIFPDTPIGVAEVGTLPSSWLAAGKLVQLAEVFYLSGAMLLEPTKPPPAKPLFETAPLVRVDAEARKLVMLSLRPGIEIIARCVGEMLLVWMHFDADRKPMICLGPDCRLCPSHRVRNGYLDAILHRNVDAGDEYFRAALILPEAAADQLELEGGEFLRGRLYAFRRNVGKRTSVAMLQLQCPYELDVAADVREVIKRRYGLSAWPCQDRTAVPEARPGILPFGRRQA